MNWASSKTRVLHIINTNGIDFTWLQRSSSTGSSYDTGSNVSYGYGDPVVTYTTGSLKGVVIHVNADEVVVEAGFYMDDYDKVYVAPDHPINIWDQLVYPDNQKYLVVSVHENRVATSKLNDTPIMISKYVIIRRLVPKSKDVY